MAQCKSVNCINSVSMGEDFCLDCITYAKHKLGSSLGIDIDPLSTRYPLQFRSVEHIQEIDVYGIHHLFNIQDPSGCIQQASKKLLLSGIQTEKTAVYADIQEAKDTLLRWLQLNKPETHL